jgi:hypothetical protein
MVPKCKRSDTFNSGITKGGGGRESHKELPLSEILKLL